MKKITNKIKRNNIKRLNIHQKINCKNINQRIFRIKTINTIGPQNQYLKNVDVDRENTRIKLINNCDKPIESFTGRRTELLKLSSKFNKHNIVVIHGVGGVGKTQLARKFAAVNKNSYNCLFCIEAEFQENLIEQLRELAFTLDIEGAKDKNINQIRNEIYGILKTQRALLIYDNVLKKADIKKYLPSVTELKNTKLHILITSQFLNWNQSIENCLPLIPLRKIHAIQLLNKILINTNRENAKDKEKLVLMLEYMPLAIQIAASYINTQMKQNDAFTITRYIEKITNDAANIHTYKHIEEYGKTLGMSIKMSLNIIREDNSYAMELVHIMSFLNPDSITKEVLSKILKINSKDAEDNFCEALQIIINYSLISSFHNILHLHRSIQEIIRDELTQTDKDIFLKYYKLVLDYVLNNEDQGSIRNTFVFKYAKDYTPFILEYYEKSKSPKLLQLLCEHGCLKNLEVIFEPLNEVNFLIEHHGLLYYATLSSDIETVKIICKYNIDVNMKYGTENITSLHIACMHGYVDIADFLIGQGADTNMKCANGRMPLHYASSGLHYDIVHRLIHISPNTVEDEDNKKQTPLQLVLNTHKPMEANNNTVKIARLLVEKGANPDTANNNSYKLIHIAALNGNYDFLAYLLENYKLDINVKNKYGNTPLFNAVAASKFMPKDHIMNKIKLLIKNGANVETTTNNDGCTLLHIAAAHCHNNIISYLLRKHNISINKTDSNGRTPLFYALFAYKSISEEDVMATVKLLIKNGAKADTISNDGCSLLHIASEYCHDKIISYLIQEHNISVDTSDSSGRTPLFCSLLADNTIPEDDVIVTVTLLIKNRANVKTINKNGCSLLHIAAENCHYKIISYFIEEHNLSVDTPDTSGRTPLFCTMRASKSIPEDDVMATVKLLIENEANVKTISNDGSSLLHVAAQNCRYKMISFLIQEHNIFVDTLDTSGRTPLFCTMLASKSIPEDDVMATAKRLIENRANVETIYKEGCNLLHIASTLCHNKIISYLIQEHNISVHTPDSSGRTPLFCALLADNSIPEDDVMTTVRQLIEFGANVETITNDGYSLLHVASAHCYSKIISYLIEEHNISVDTPDSSGQTPLFCALLASKSIPEDDVMATVKLLIENAANVKTISNDGYSLLHVAAENCHYKIISHLIQEHNISVDTPDNDGETPLFCALRASKSIPEDDVMATVKLLIKNEDNVKTINNDGCSLLHVAAENSHYKIIAYLIQEHNISVDTPDNDGETPLFCALLADNSIPEDDVMATVKLLIENEANVETITNDGCSLLHVAAEYCRYKIISYLIQEHNISVDRSDSSGRTPLFYALLASKSIPEDDVMATVKLLIENEANVETVTNDSCSLMHVAAGNCHCKIISYLIQEHNISVDTLDNDGETPLFYALLASISIPEDDVMATVKLLIENEANVETINNDGCSLMHVAAENCHYKIIAYLIQEHNISVDTADNNGETPLFCTLRASKSIPEDDVMMTVKLLIENEANVETLTNDGSCILHFAAENCRYKIIAYLIQEHNISVDTPDNDGETPLFCTSLASKSIPEDDVMATVKLLIENEANVETINNDGCSLMHVAAENCRYKIISYLIQEHNISVDTADNDGETPLFCALRASKSIPEDDVMATVKLLIENEANVETINNDGCSLLHVAAENCRYKIIPYLIQEHNISVDKPDSSGRTPLFCALLADNSIPEDDVMATVMLLIENKANVETVTNDGSFILHFAAENCHYKIISYLIQEHNISVDTTDNDGETPLFCTLLASKSIPEDDVMATVKLLIENEANVETINNDGCSLLHVAAENCRYKIISYLIQEHNISVDTANSSGRTSLFCALLADNSIPEEDVMATAKLLIENEADVETINNDGCSLLHVAAENCRYKIISYLIQEHNISVDTPDNDGETPLVYALLASKSIPEDDVMATVKLLIENGADVKTVSNHGSSLLHVAAENCLYTVISYLIQKLNISIDALDNDGDSPLFCALAASNSIPEDDVMATVKLLIKNEANVETINNDGCSLLHVAAENCHDKVISYLIQEHNMSVDTPNYNGESPLFSALLTPKSLSEDDILKTIKVLIEMGARVDILDNKCNSLFHIAAEKNLRKIITYLFNNHKVVPLLHALLASEHEDKVMKMIELLAEKRAHKGRPYKKGTDLLHVAARYGCHEIILHLIQKYDLPVTITDSFGRSPLFCALKASKFIPEEDVMETTKLLIAHGATVEATDNTGCTILHYATQFGRYQALSYLLHNYNINIDTQDQDGDTPLHCALIADESINQKTVKKIIKKLLFNSASINLKNNKDQTALDLASPAVREFILKSYAKASKRRIPEITQQTAKRRKN